MCIKKKYGSEKTKLILTEKSQKLYNESDIIIYELVNYMDEVIGYDVELYGETEHFKNAEALISAMENFYNDYLIW